MEFHLQKLLIFWQNYQWISSLGLTFLYFECKSLYFHNWGKNLSFLVKCHLWPTISKYRFENSKCTKVRLDLIFIDNFCQNIKSLKFNQNLLNSLKTGQKLTRTFCVHCNEVRPKCSAEMWLIIGKVGMWTSQVRRHCCKQQTKSLSFIQTSPYYILEI